MSLESFVLLDPISGLITSSGKLPLEEWPIDAVALPEELVEVDNLRDYYYDGQDFQLRPSIENPTINGTTITFTNVPVGSNISIVNVDGEAELDSIANSTTSTIEFTGLPDNVDVYVILDPPSPWKDTIETLTIGAGGLGPRPSIADVSKERDRRMELNYSYMSKEFATDAESKRKIVEIAAIARAKPSNQRNTNPWFYTNVNFSWIATDNTLVEMTANEFIAFADAIALRDSTLVQRARTLKDMYPTIPYNYTDESWWIV